MRRTPLTVLLALTALVLATTAPALAQSAEDEYIAEAVGDGYSIEFLGQVTEESIFGGVSEVEVTSDPSADAFGVGTSLAEDSESSATATSDGESESDVGNCAVPDMPAEELQFVGDLLNSCSSAEAAIADGLPTADAEADGLELNVSGDLIVDAIVDTVLAELAGQIDPVLSEVEDQALDPVIEGLIQACNEALAEIEDEELDPLRDVLEQSLDELPEEFDELEEALEEAINELGLEEETCLLLFDILTLTPGIGDEEGVLEALGEVLREALEGQSLLLVQLAGSDSFAGATAEEAVADSEAIGLYVELLSLEVVGDLVEALFGDLVDQFLEELEEAIDLIDETFVQQIPEAGEMVSDILQGLDLAALLDDPDPLLTITAGQTTAAASFDRSTGDASASGTATALSVCLSEGLLGFLGLEDQACVEVAEGDELVLLEDTPLESRLAASFVSVDDDAERGGLSGAEVTAEAVALSLIQFEEDGWVVDVAAGASHAAAFGAVGEALDAPPELPITGGGLALVAVALLGAGLLLRRRD